MAEPLISVKDYVDVQFRAVNQRIDDLTTTERRYEDMVDRKNEKAVELSDEALAERTKVALDAVTEHNVKSNGLIEMMRGMMSEFINWRVVMSFLTGAGIVSGIYFGFVK